MSYLHTHTHTHPTHAFGKQNRTPRTEPSRVGREVGRLGTLPFCPSIRRISSTPHVPTIIPVRRTTRRHHTIPYHTIPRGEYSETHLGHFFFLSPIPLLGVLFCHFPVLYTMHFGFVQLYFASQCVRACVRVCVRSTDHQSTHPFPPSTPFHFRARRTMSRMRMCACVRVYVDRKSTRLNSSHSGESRMPSSA